jgi:hypothetical protein
MKITKPLLLSLIFVSAVIGFSVSTSRAATPSAPYEVLVKEGDFEQRSYPLLHLAKVTMPATQGTAGKKAENSSFMQLFRFIDGANERSEKISMTTPVLVDKMARTMSFVMPQDSVQRGLPAPKSESIALTQQADCQVVAIRFTSRSKPEWEAQELERLRTWAKAKGIPTTGEPLYAYYDPPWTPGFMRRNEILLRVKPIKKK